MFESCGSYENKKNQKEKILFAKRNSKRKKELQRQLKSKIQNGVIDVDLERKLKKRQNFCNKIIKSFVREKAGQNITSDSNVQEIWKSVNGILRPQKCSPNTLKIETMDKVIEEPLQIAEKFNTFFKEKIEKTSKRNREQKYESSV